MPGTVQAANYDTGGQGTGYSVASVNGSANSYRPDGVDLEACSDTGCGDDIGWTGTGQWFRYTVNVATARTYTVTLRLSSPSGVTDALHIASSSGANLSGSVNAPNTGGWQTYATATVSVALPAGQQTLTIYQDNGGWNIHDLTFSLAPPPPRAACQRIPRRGVRWTPAGRYVPNARLGSLLSVQTRIRARWRGGGGACGGGGGARGGGGRGRNVLRIRCTMHVCTIAAGETFTDHVGQALQPVADHEEHIPDPAVLQVGQHAHPELGALPAGPGPQPQDVLLPGQGDPDRGVDGPVGDLPVRGLSLRSRR